MAEKDTSLLEKLDGVEKLVKEDLTKIDERQEETDKVVSEIRDAQKADAEEVDDRLKKVEKAVRGSHIEAASALLDVIPERDRKQIDLAGRTMSKKDRQSDLLKDPVNKAAVCLWMREATFAQTSHRKATQAEHMANVEKIGKALEDKFGGAEYAKDAFTTGTDALGGFLVPKPVEDEILRIVTDNSVLRSNGVRTVPMASKTLDLPAENSAITAAIIGEGSAITDSIPATPIQQVTVTARKYAGRAVASIESLEDSAASIMDYVRDVMTEKIARLEDTEGLEGATAGSLGVSGETGVGSVAAGTNGDAISYAKLISIYSTVGESSVLDRALWIMHIKAWAKVLGLVDDQNLPIFRMAPEGQPRDIFGHRVVVFSGILTNRTKGTGTSLTNIYFGDPRGVVLGDRAGLSWAVTDAPNFTTAQVDMRLLKRTGNRVALPAAWVKGLDLQTI